MFAGPSVVVPGIYAFINLIYNLSALPSLERTDDDDPQDPTVSEQSIHSLIGHFEDGPAE